MEKLTPFTPAGTRFGLTASIASDAGRLHLRYALSDPLREVVGGPMPGVHTGLRRADGLWQRTCFEAFLALKGSASYWELNLAPDGSAWNLYRFDGYRVPQPPRPSEDFSLERVEVGAAGLECWLLPRVDAGPLDASLCAVVRTAAGPQYLSTRHAGEKPDFHLRASFSLAVG